METDFVIFFTKYELQKTVLRLGIKERLCGSIYELLCRVCGNQASTSKLNSGPEISVY